MNDAFCPIPWIFQAVRNNGDIRICCQANITENQGVVRHEDNTPYNVARDSMKEALNAPLMKQVRNNMLNGEWSTECQRCRQEEESGLNSRRQYELSNWNLDLEQAKKITDKDGSLLQINTKYYDLRFGNLCNLACRMCGPTDSHTWYEQWTGYHGVNKFKDTHGIVELIRNDKGRLTTSDYDWHDSENFWNQIESNIVNIEHIYMAGGEPMMIERHYEFLQKCIDAGCAHRIILEYNTNMTNLPNRVLEMWKSFKQIRVGASIDGIENVLEYQRWPIKWDQAYKNLKKLDEYAQQNLNVIPWLACTITAYNIWHIPKFIEWKINQSGFKKINSSKKKPIITHHIAHGPRRTNIRILPLDIKKDIEFWYIIFIEKISNNKEIPDDIKLNIEKILKGIVNYMFKEDYSDSLPEFIRFTNYMDRQRNQNILDIIPTYSKIFLQK
jgi:organic radical activating enzyme